MSSMCLHHLWGPSWFPWISSHLVYEMWCFFFEREMERDVAKDGVLLVVVWYPEDQYASRPVAPVVI